MRRRFTSNRNTFDYSKYMTIEALEDGYEVYFGTDLEYNLNGREWVSLKAFMISPTLKKGDLLSLRGSIMPNDSLSVFGNSKAINLRGNILSLIFKDEINLDISRYPDVFRHSFTGSNGNNIISIEKNFLPATTLSIHCYSGMFQGNKNLVSAPELPATVLTLCCYDRMFLGCTSLTTAPELPATTLVSRCYWNMFEDCTKLNYIKMLATDIISITDCLNSWVYNVSSTGIFVKNKDATWRESSVIPRGWTVQTA